MKSDFDYSRLESNLYLNLLAVFQSKTGIAFDIDDLSPSSRFDGVWYLLEELAIKWLRGRESRTIEMLEHHLWPTLCELATLPPKEYEDYDEFDFWYHEVLGLIEADGPEPETTFVLKGLACCARALASADEDTRREYASSACRCCGLVDGVELQRLESAENGRESASSALGRIGANARHKENRALKADALRYYEEHRHDFTTKDDAALAIAEKIVPVKFRTVREWLKDASASER